MGGPIWAEPTFDPDWVTATQQKMKQRQSVGSSLPRCVPVLHQVSHGSELFGGAVWALRIGSVGC